MAIKVLVVDDKSNIRNMIRDYLEAEGFQVIVATNGKEALISARNTKPDLILLDIMMPEMSGIDFIKHFRRECNTPVIILTAKLDESDKVLGLELGADDYVTKPFSLKELTARIRAVMRRNDSRTMNDEDVISVRDICVELHSHLVTVGGQQIVLTHSEFDLLVILMTSPGRVFSRSELLVKLQGSSFENIERTIDVHICNLRSKIEPVASTPIYIETVFGYGYRFIPE